MANLKVMNKKNLKDFTFNNKIKRAPRLNKPQDTMQYADGGYTTHEHYLVTYMYAQT